MSDLGTGSGFRTGDSSNNIQSFFGRETGAHEVVGLDALEQLERNKTCLDETQRDGFCDPERGNQLTLRIALRISADGTELLDIQTPTDQARREARVLTFATDRNGQIIRRDFQEDPVGLVV